jgi:hypothetical protein
VDDVADAFAVHGVGGLWGLLAAGLVGTPANYLEAYPHAGRARAAQCAGVWHGGDGRALAANGVLALALLGWAAAWSGLAFGGLRHLLWLRRHSPLGANLDDSTHADHVLQVGRGCWNSFKRPHQPAGQHTAEHYSSSSSSSSFICCAFQRQTLISAPAYRSSTWTARTPVDK